MFEQLGHLNDLNFSTSPYQIKIKTNRNQKSKLWQILNYNDNRQ